MANLIIKSSADNLVLQGSDASPAITVGATGTTTFAENTTLSGTANNLGTVATMVLPTASATAVYPVGHVVQTTSRFRDSTLTNLGTQTGTGNFANTVVTGTITPKYDDSSIIIFANFVMQIGDDVGDSGVGFRIVKTGTGVTSLHGSPRIGPVDGDTQTEGHASYYFNGYNYNQMVMPNQLVQVDNDCETTNTITYTLQGIIYNIGSNVKVGGNEWYNYDWSIFFQEIKR